MMRTLANQSGSVRNTQGEPGSLRCYEPAGGKKLASRVRKHPGRVPLGAAMVALCLGAGPTEPLRPAERLQSTRALVPTKPQVDGLIDLAMYKDPWLEPPVRTDVFNPRLKTLWLQALQRPGADTRRRAVAAFGQAHIQGMPGLEDIPERLKGVLRDDPHRLVRLAAARALDQFDAVSAAAVMLDRSAKDGADMALTVDPSLARWQFRSAGSLWLARLQEKDTPYQVRVSAMRCMGLVRQTDAIEPLLALVTDPAVKLALRFEAGRALGRITESAQVLTAAQLAGGPPIPDRLVSVYILASHRDEKAIKLLLQLASGGDEDPTVVATALDVLYEIDPKLIHDRASQWLDHPDPNVRLSATKAMAVRRDAEAIAMLMLRLDDSDVVVRHLARRTLAEYDADAVLGPQVRVSGMRVMADNGWRGLEQAALLLGILDHEPAAERLIELMVYPRPEVRLAAATALRLLAVEATLESLHERAEQLTQEYHPSLEKAKAASLEKIEPDLSAKVMVIPEASGMSGAKCIGRETTQLMMAMGDMDYRPAEPLMRRYIPKGSFDVMARAAAIWALGKLREGRADSTLVTLLEARLADVHPPVPEMEEVRRFSAISLGRMQDAAPLETLHSFLEMEQTNVEIGGACRWAIIQITGEQLPPLRPFDVDQTGWFLEPLE